MLSYSGYPHGKTSVNGVSTIYGPASSVICIVIGSGLSIYAVWAGLEGKTKSHTLPAPFWEYASTECQGLMVFKVR